MLTINQKHSCIYMHSSRSKQQEKKKKPPNAKSNRFETELGLLCKIDFKAETGMEL